MSECVKYDNLLNMMVDEEKIRAHLVIVGRVQGVFFRAETSDIARRLGLAGWVRNKPDGSVEAVFEGHKEKVQEAIAWCRVGPREARVDDVQVEELLPSGEFEGFSVTR